MKGFLAKNYDSWVDKIVRAMIYAILFMIVLVVILPIMHIISCSFSSADDIIAGKVTIFPVSFTLDSYRAIFNHQDLIMGFLNSLFYATLGPVISVAMTIALGYPLSKEDMPGKGIILRIMMVTMLFSGGMIPTYLVSKSVGLTNNRFGFLFLAGALSVYNVFVARTFFKNSIDQSIYDSAEVDGASAMRCLVSIVLPLSKAVIAVLLLWEIVGYWNNYQNALIYLTDRNLQPLQIIIREIMEMNSVNPDMIKDSRDYQELRNLQVTLKYATIVVSSIPLMIIYPFVQKHFVKGVMVGAVKE